MAEKPNVIVFFTDQQRHDTTGIHGNPLDLTPNFDRMAREGTDIHHMFTCQPVCGPARSCLQTGMYATQTGSVTNGIPLNQELDTLAKAFNRGGYRTGYIGKWHLGPRGEKTAVPAEWRGGYEDWLAANALEHTSDAYQTRMWDTDNKPVDLPGYRVDAQTDAAIRYIDAQKDSDNPFFLFISYLEPHHQNHRDDYPAPTGYEERYRDAWTPPDLATLGGTSQRHLPGYYGMVKRLDEALGRLLDTLKSLDMLENTVVLFTSDHACHFKTRNEEYKRSAHESSIRVPAAIRGPGFEGGGRLDKLVSLVDLPPTLLDAAGLPIPDQMAGRSILGPVHDRDADWPDDVFVQISESHTGRAVRTKRWKYAIAAPDADRRAPGSDTYVETELYDLLADPYELNNLIGKATHAEVHEVMRGRIKQYIQDVEGIDITLNTVEQSGGGQMRVTSEEAHR